jgi:hypothetical protein
MLRSFTLEVMPDHKADYEATLRWLGTPEAQTILDEMGAGGLESYTIVQRGDLTFDVDLEAEHDLALDAFRADARVWPLTWVPRAQVAAPPPGAEAGRQVRFQWRRRQ